MLDTSGCRSGSDPLPALTFDQIDIIGEIGAAEDLTYHLPDEMDLSDACKGLVQAGILKASGRRRGVTSYVAGPRAQEAHALIEKSRAIAYSRDAAPWGGYVAPNLLVALARVAAGHTARKVGVLSAWRGGLFGLLEDLSRKVRRNHEAKAASAAACASMKRGRYTGCVLGTEPSANQIAAWMAAFHAVHPNNQGAGHDALNQFDGLISLARTRVLPADMLADGWAHVTSLTDSGSQRPPAATWDGMFNR